jgi:hypothetical protein
MTAADALLQQVTQDRDRRCAQVRAAAMSQAQQIVRTARTQARQSVHNAVTQERGRMDFGLRQATARADIEVRREEQQVSQVLLGNMWAGIADALARRWQEPAPRRAWLAAALGQAGGLLGGRPWLIESGAEWTQQERGELLERARSSGAATVTFALRAGMPAGLTIRSDRVSVDATVPGLLAQRAAIEAAFLAEYLPEQRTDG